MLLWFYFFKSGPGWPESRQPTSKGWKWSSYSCHQQTLQIDGEMGRPKPGKHPSFYSFLHPSFVYPSLLPHIPSGAKGGSSRMSHVHKHSSSDLDCEASLWTAGVAFVPCVFVLIPSLWAEDQQQRPRGPDSRRRGWCNTWNPTTSATVHRGIATVHTHSYSCNIYFLHAQSRSKLGNLGLEAPTLIFVFFATRSRIPSLTNVRCGEAVLVFIKKKETDSSSIRLRLHRKSMKLCWVIYIPTSVWSHLPLHLCTSPHVWIFFFFFLWPQTHSSLLKKTWPEPARSAAALYPPRSLKVISDALPVLSVSIAGEVVDEDQPPMHN